jgi:hypothetical protein
MGAPKKVDCSLESQPAAVPPAKRAKKTEAAAPTALPHGAAVGAMPKGAAMPPAKQPAAAAAMPAKQAAAIGAGPPRRPDPPLKPEGNAKASLWSSYYQQVVQFVLKHLMAELKAECSINLDAYKELRHVPPTCIDKNNSPAIGGVALTTYKETWNIKRCLKALESTGKYEAAGSLWWFFLLTGAVEFLSKIIFTSNPHRLSVEAAAALWDEAAFLASDLQAHRRRYNFPGVLPTACNGMPDAEAGVKTPGVEDKTPTFNNLPLVAGRAPVLALLEAIIACMVSTKVEDKRRLRFLFEARGPHGFCPLRMHRGILTLSPPQE